VSILAFERFLGSNKTATCERQSWIGLSVLAAGLSLDELASIHERTPFLFSSWGLSGNMNSLIPLAVPALLLLLFTLQRMWNLANRRCFWLTLSAFIILGSVASQEDLEHTLQWPWWARGMRFVIEEGTELVGIFLLLSVVLGATVTTGMVKSIRSLMPRAETLIQLRPTVAYLSLLGFIPLGMLTVATLVVTEARGAPSAWLPFVLLNMACMAAWASADLGETYRKRFLFVSFLALFFSLDQIIVFQRVLDKNLMRGDVENVMFPCLAVVCLGIPTLRTRSHILLLGVLLSLSLFLLPPSELFPRLVIPLQSLGIFWILVSGLRTAQSGAPTRLKAGVMRG
jgi:hypothetical protein